MIRKIAAKDQYNLHAADFIPILQLFSATVKYSPPIEAGASFNPPNLAEDFILQSSFSKTMGFYETNPSRTPYGTAALRTTFGNLIYVFW